MKRTKFNLRPKLWKKFIKVFGIQKINIRLSILGKRNIATSKYLLLVGILEILIVILFKERSASSAQEQEED